MRSHGVGFGARPSKLFVNPTYNLKNLGRTLPLSSQSGRKQGGLINRPYGCVHMYSPCTYIDYSVWDSSGVVYVPSTACIRRGSAVVPRSACVWPRFLPGAVPPPPHEIWQLTVYMLMSMVAIMGDSQQCALNSLQQVCHSQHARKRTRSL